MLGRDFRSIRLRRGALWILLAVAAVLLIGAFQLLDSDASGDTTSESKHARVEAIAGTTLSRVTLSQQAAERLGIQTSRVRAGGPSTMRKVVPYAALLYDTVGDTWVYASPETRVFVRAPVEVARIDGDRALLSTGPPAGTVVVTVGVAELYGTELEIDH